MKKIKIAFRLDDPSAISPIDIEKNLIDIFSHHELSCTFGVIPNVTLGNFRDTDPADTLTLPDEKIQIFKQAAKNNILDIALHGYEHKTIVTDCNEHSEFRGADLNSQLTKIRVGKNLLEQQIETTISTFIPPWNTYDENTLNALIHNKITCISSNRYQPYSQKTNINFIPITIEFPDLKSAVDTARINKDSEPNIIILMHPYDFKESGDNRAQYNCQDVYELLHWINQQDDLDVFTVSQLAMSSDNYSHSRYAWNKPSLLENIYPPGIIHTENTPIYHSISAAKHKKVKNTALTISFFISVILLTTLLTYNLLSDVLDTNEIITKGLLYSLVLLLTLLTLKVFKQGTYYFRSFFLSNILLGAIVGLTLI